MTYRLGVRTRSGEPRYDPLHEPDRVVRTLVLPSDEFTMHSQTFASEPSLIDPRAELLLWGQEVGDEFTGLLHPVGHELSTAARAFKAQALRSAGLDIRVEAYEQFRAGNLYPKLFGRLLGQQRPHDTDAHWDVTDIYAPSTSPKLVGGRPRG